MVRLKMDLIDRIKEIARAHEIPEDRLILAEARWFLEEHRYHGVHQLQLSYQRKKLSRIVLYCEAGDLVQTRICSHHGDRDGEESLPSVIYFTGKATTEIKYQEKRRS